MADKIWFIRRNNKPIAAFGSKLEAKEEYEELVENDFDDNFRLYNILVDDIEEYEDEMSLAEEEGLI